MRSIQRQVETCYLFGGLRYLPDTGLFQGERLIKVPPKETRLLELLLKEHGEIVTHAMIEGWVWPRQTVSYDSMARCVYSLRRILLELGVDCVQTVHKRGYRISVPVEEMLGNAPVPARINAASTGNPVAFAHYAAGIREASIPTPQKFELAVDFLDLAVKEDPGYCAALASIADVRMYQCVRGYLEPRAALQQATRVCNAALERDGDHVPSLAVLAWFEGMIGQQLEAGLARINHALEIDPEYAPAYAYRSWFMRANGDAAAAVGDQRKGLALDPHALLNRHGFAFTQFHNLEVNEALNTERELAGKYPDDDTCHAYRALFAAYVGEREEALAAASRCMELSRHIPSATAVIAYVEALVGNRKKADKLIQFSLGSAHPHCPKPMIVPALLALGRGSEALECLKASKSERCPWFYGMRTDPRLSPLLSENGQSLYR